MNPELVRAFATLILGAAELGPVRIAGLGTFRFITTKPKRVVTYGVERVLPPKRALKFRAAPGLGSKP